MSVGVVQALSAEFSAMPGWADAGMVGTGREAAWQVNDVVIGLDLGTTATKAVAFALGGASHGSASVAFPLDTSTAGRAVQDPDAALEAALEAVRECADEVRTHDADVVGLCLTGGMHGLLGLGADGRPVTPVVTWADGRAAPQSRRLRATGAGGELHRRTGAPVHPSFPRSKLAWFAEEDPDTCARVACWSDLKGYVLEALTGERCIDLSFASGTGLLDLRTRGWSAEAVEAARTRVELLPELVDTTHVLALRADVATRAGLPAGTPVVAGAGDGPMANLGVGASRPGVAALSLGTSGALRVAIDAPAVDAGGALFCYAITAERWVTGGAVTNGGQVLDFARDLLGGPLERDNDPATDIEALLERAAAVPPGSEGLLALPYLLPERAPLWDPDPRAAFVGLERGHGPGHVVRALVEGVALQLASVAAAVVGAGFAVDEVRATGGAFRSPLWRDVVAAALDAPIGLTEGPEGTAYGAALLGHHALGALPDLDDAAGLVRVAQTVAPDPAAAATYARLRPLLAELPGALAPFLARLREGGDPS